MLAPNDDPLKNPNFFAGLKWPLDCSFKYDGIRNIVKNGVCKSRSFIDLPSNQVQELFCGYEDLDGEITAGDIDAELFNRTSSHVMSRDKPSGNLKFFVFDTADLAHANTPFQERLLIARDMVTLYNEHYSQFNVHFVEHTRCNNLEELLMFEEKALELNFEGVMMRDPFGRYKHGRGTYLEGLIYKLKRFQDDEGVVVGFVEQQHNTNKDVRDNLGNAKRSSSKEGLIGADTVGKILISYKGEVIPIARGVLKKAQLQHIWDNQLQYIGRIAKFRYFGFGMKDLPRYPRFVGWRDKMDM